MPIFNNSQPINARIKFGDQALALSGNYTTNPDTKAVYFKLTETVLKEATTSAKTAAPSYYYKLVPDEGKYSVLNVFFGREGGQPNRAQRVFLKIALRASKNLKERQALIDTRDKLLSCNLETDNTDPNPAGSLLSEKLKDHKWRLIRCHPPELEKLREEGKVVYRSRPDTIANVVWNVMTTTIGAPGRILQPVLAAGSTAASHAGEMLAKRQLTKVMPEKMANLVIFCLVPAVQAANETTIKFLKTVASRTVHLLGKRAEAAGDRWLENNVRHREGEEDSRHPVIKGITWTCRFVASAVSSCANVFTSPVIENDIPATKTPTTSS